MRDFTAIQYAGFISSADRRLKRDVLMFDRLYLISLTELIDSFRNYKHGDEFTINLETHTTQAVERDPEQVRAFAADLEWLVTQGIITDASNLPVDEEYRRMMKLQDSDEMSRMISKHGDSVDMEEFGRYVANSWLRKVWALCQSLYKRGDDVTCFVPLDSILGPLDNGKCDVAHIVLQSVPVPKDDTPWEQIVEFRRDDDSQKKLQALRHWIRKMATQDSSPRQLEDEIDWLLHQYQEHMKLHQMKTNPGTLETVVTAGPEFVENLLRLNLGKAARMLFTAKHRKIALLEAELTAPGRELAYITQIGQEFG